MLFSIYYLNYFMKNDRIHVYDRAIEKLNYAFW